MDNYRSCSIKELSAMLNRSEKSVSQKKIRLGLLIHKSWDDKAIDILNNNTIKKSSQILNKTENSCRIKKMRLRRK